MENSLAVPQKLNIEWRYDPAILLLSVYPWEWKHMSTQKLYIHVQSSIIHNSPKVEKAQISINWGLYVLQPYKGILISHKKEWHSDICYNMDEPWKHYAKWKKALTK